MCFVTTIFPRMKVEQTVWDGRRDGSSLHRVPRGGFSLLFVVDTVSPSGVGGRLLVAHRKGLGDPGLGVGPLERKPPWDLGVGAEAGMDLRLPVVLGVAGPLTLSLDALSSASFPGTVPG